MPVGAIKPNLSYILRLRHQSVESINLSVPGCSEFRMKPNRYMHSRCATHQCKCSLPRKRCRRNCQDEALPFGGLLQDTSRVFIQVKVVMKVSQIAPTSLRNALSSAIPRSARSV